MLELVSEAASLKKLWQAAVKSGMVPLAQDGFEKVKAGITTIDEILRVVEYTK